ncbi:hypothetical protein LTR17_018052 [Elasticomyces elasticus]|nr:hypothetical protein LTR17_018052 [Elasticomyces elasticus]
MSLTSALSELSLASHDVIQTAQTIQAEGAGTSSTQITNNENKPLLEAHEAPSDVVFRCTLCHLHFKTEKRLQNHIRYSRAHSIGSGSATTEDPITYDSFDMRPALHGDVSRLLEAYNLSFMFVVDDGQRSLKEKVTSIRGTFTCTNADCSFPQTWMSGKVAITIKMYARGQYNARVYYQRCKSCDFVCRPELDSTYAERVSYRLAKWSGKRMQALPHGANAPHDPRLCEGCRAGYPEHTKSFDPNIRVIRG